MMDKQAILWFFFTCTEPEDRNEAREKGGMREGRGGVREEREGRGNKERD